MSTTSLDRVLGLGAQGALSLLPHSLAAPLGRLLGRVFYRFARYHRRTAIENVAFVFPELSPPERHALARESFRSVGVAWMETLAVASWGRSKLLERSAVEGLEHLHEAARQGRGVFLLTGHLGCWEVGGLILGLHAGPLDVIVRPSKQRSVDTLLRVLRERFGNRVLAKRRAARQILRVVQAGGKVVVLIDQRARSKDGISVPFLGRPSRSSPALARLSLRTGAPVVPFFAFADHGGFRVLVEPAIVPTGSGPAAVPVLTRRYLEAIERQILLRPSEWMWMHRRWHLIDLCRPGDRPEAAAGEAGRGPRGG